MRKLINNERFTIRFVTVMNGLNIKTIGSAYKFLKQCNSHLKIGGVRVHYLLKEIESYVKVGI